MMKQSLKEELKKIIKDGFDLDLISFELDIPLEELEQLKNEMNSNRITFNENNQICLRIEQMKQKYRALFLTDNTPKNIQSKKLSNQDIEAINSAISTIQSAIETLNPSTKKENDTTYSTIFESIKQLKAYPLTIGQAEAIIPLLNSEELNRLNVSTLYCKDKYRSQLNNAKLSITNKLLASIDEIQSQTDDMNELKALRRKITPEIEKAYYLASNSLKNKISTRIIKIQQANPLDKCKTAISPSILGIISTLSDGTIDIPSAKSIIAEEAKKAVNSNPKNKFSLTEVQEQNRILFQIRENIVKDTNNYDIHSPELLVSQMQELCNISLEQSLSMVIDSLIVRKNFKTASALFDKFYYDEKNTDSKGIKPLKIKIINAEIGDIVSRMLNSSEEAEDQIEVFKLLEEKIKSKKINLKAISLGKSKDGLKDITFADIWENELQNEF